MHPYPLALAGLIRGVLLVIVPPLLIVALPRSRPPAVRGLFVLATRRHARKIHTLANSNHCTAAKQYKEEIIGGDCQPLRTKLSCPNIRGTTGCGARPARADASSSTRGPPWTLAGPVAVSCDLRVH